MSVANLGGVRFLLSVTLPPIIIGSVENHLKLNIEGTHFPIEPMIMGGRVFIHRQLLPPKFSDVRSTTMSTNQKCQEVEELDL